MFETLRPDSTLHSLGCRGNILKDWMPPKYYGLVMLRGTLPAANPSGVGYAYPSYPRIRQENRKQKRERMRNETMTHAIRCLWGSMLILCLLAALSIGAVA